MRGYAAACSEDVHIFSGLSGMELWGCLLGCVHFFYDEEVSGAFQRTDFRLMRTAAFSQEASWESLTAKILSRFDREGRNDTCTKLQGASERCGLVFASWKIHRTPDPQQRRTPRHRVTAPRFSRHQSVHQLWQHTRRPSQRAEPRRQLLVNSQSRADRSDTRWALDDVTSPIGYKLCAQ